MQHYLRGEGLKSITHYFVNIIHHARAEVDSCQHVICVGERFGKSLFVVQILRSHENSAITKLDNFLTSGNYGNYVGIFSKITEIAFQFSYTNTPSKKPTI